MNGDDARMLTLILFITSLFIIGFIVDAIHFAETRSLITTQCGSTP